jgi:hypothetical protein
MADLTTGYVYGLRDVKLTSLDGLTQVDLDAAQTLSFTEVITSDQLRGDDVIKLEQGGITLEALALITGETVATTGSTPNRMQTFTRTGGMPFKYLKIYGQAVGDGVDGIWLQLLKAKFNSLEGEFAQQSYFVTSSGGMAIPDASNQIYKIVKLETNAALPTS